MALQLLKRNFTMQGCGYERPKILKLPQGEMRWAPKRVPVDVGDVMMNIRMDSGKNKFIAEHVSKYAQGNNPYGQWGNPYKVNKNFRPPVYDPRLDQPISRMPVKFDIITAGPIVKDLYQKQQYIDAISPKTIIDTTCQTSASSNPSCKLQDVPPPVCKLIKDVLNQPQASIGYHPSIPVFNQTFNASYELDPKIFTRAQAGIHAPYNISDQSRDIHNMRTPTHVAYKPTIKGTTIDNEWIRQGPDLTPSLKTPVWFNPRNYLSGDIGWGIENTSKEFTKDCINVAGQTNISGLQQDGEKGEFNMIYNNLQKGGYFNGATIPTVQMHQDYLNVRPSNNLEYFTTPNERPVYHGNVPNFNSSIGATQLDLTDTDYNQTPLFNGQTELNLNSAPNSLGGVNRSSFGSTQLFPEI